MPAEDVYERTSERNRKEHQMFTLYRLYTRAMREACGLHYSLPDNHYHGPVGKVTGTIVRGFDLGLSQFVFSRHEVVQYLNDQLDDKILCECATCAKWDDAIDQAIWLGNGEGADFADWWSEFGESDR